MTIYNLGILTVCHIGNVSNDYAWKKAVAVLSENGLDDTVYGIVYNEKAREISFEEYGGSFLDDDLRAVQEALKPDVWLEGNLEYYGDYDGWIDVARDGIESGDKSSEDLHYASDKELIDILKRRGYTVTKTKKSKKVEKK